MSLGYHSLSFPGGSGVSRKTWGRSLRPQAAPWVECGGKGEKMGGVSLAARIYMPLTAKAIRLPFRCGRWPQKQFIAQSGRIMEMSLRDIRDGSQQRLMFATPASPSVRVAQRAEGELWTEWPQ